MKFLYLISGVYASMFVTDLRDRNSCFSTELIKEVDKLYPVLKDCYQYTSLYFSTLSSPCSSECFDATIKASKYLTDKCDISKPGKGEPMISHRELVYSLWADSKAAHVVCKKGENRRCLGELVYYAPRLISSHSKELDPKKVCTSCTKALYHQFRDSPYTIPVVYYQIMNEPHLVLKSLGELCQWS